MKVLLDENVPIQTLDLLTRVLRKHEIHHVDRLRWKGKKDNFLLRDAAARGYDAIVTKDANQLADPLECRAIKQSRMHHIRFRQLPGVRGLAAAVASVLVAMPHILEELETVSGQRLVDIHGIDPRRPRHTTTDPRVSPPEYW